jgi:uncharacterized transporter YbjL
VGPQFFRGLKKNALSQVSLTLVLCFTSLLVTLGAAKIYRYDPGTAAGLMAGAFTESTVIGTAGDTISRLELPEAEKTRLLNNIPVAYAVSYLVGTGFVVWFFIRSCAAVAQGGPERGEPQARGRDIRGSAAWFAVNVRIPGMGHPRLPHRRDVGEPESGRSRALLFAEPRLRAALATRRSDH